MRALNKFMKILSIGKYDTILFFKGTNDQGGMLTGIATIIITLCVLAMAILLIWWTVEK